MQAELGRVPQPLIGRRRVLVLAVAGVLGGVAGCAASGDDEVATPVRKACQELLSVVSTTGLVVDQFVAGSLPRLPAAVALGDVERTCRKAVDDTQRLRPLGPQGIDLCRRVLDLGASVRGLVAQAGAAVRNDDPAVAAGLRPDLARQWDALDGLINELAGS